MKKLSISILVSLTLLSFNAAAEFKAAYINSGTILKEAPQTRAADEAMKAEFASRQQALRSVADEIKKEESNLQKDAAIMSAEQRSKMEAALNEKKRKFQFDAQSLQEDADLRRKQELQKLRTSISKIIQDYAKKQGYDLVFTEGVAYADEKVDITDEILKELKKQ
jgi:outer membrane protein